MLKIYKTRLIKVCKVLFPRYKYVKIDNIRRIAILKTCKTPVLRWFFRGWRVSLTELIGVQIPSQLADFKYDNKTFISVIQEDLVRCELMKQNKIDYFLDEITKIKYADIYKTLKITPKTVNLTPAPDEEDEMFEEMVQLYKVKEQPKKYKPIGTKPFWVSAETWFYVLILLLVTYVLLNKLNI